MKPSEARGCYKNGARCWWKSHQTWVTLLWPETDAFGTYPVRYPVGTENGWTYVEATDLEWKERA